MWQEMKSCDNRETKTPSYDQQDHSQPLHKGTCCTAERINNKQGGKWDEYMTHIYIQYHVGVVYTSWLAFYATFSLSEGVTWATGVVFLWTSWSDILEVCLRWRMDRGELVSLWLKPPPTLLPLPTPPTFLSPSSVYILKLAEGDGFGARRLASVRTTLLFLLGVLARRPDISWVTPETGLTSAGFEGDPMGLTFSSTTALTYTMSYSIYYIVILWVTVYTL